MRRKSLTIDQFRRRYSNCTTRQQRKLQDIADAMLAKSGFFPKPVEQSQDEIDFQSCASPDMISASGRLRRPW